MGYSKNEKDFMIENYEHLLHLYDTLRSDFAELLSRHNDFAVLPDIEQFYMYNARGKQIHTRSGLVYYNANGKLAASLHNNVKKIIPPSKVKEVPDGVVLELARKLQSGISPKHLCLAYNIKSEQRLNEIFIDFVKKHATKTKDYKR
jgi:hypothetical protein